MKKMKVLLFSALFCIASGAEILIHNTIPFFYMIFGIGGAILLIGIGKSAAVLLLQKDEDYYDK